MARKQFKVSRRMLFTWFMLTGFIFLISPQSLVSQFHFAFARIFSWPLGVGRSISLSARMPQSHAEQFKQAEARYQNHIANLEFELQEVQQKLEKLTQMRQRRPLEGAKLILSDIIMSNFDGTHNELIINRGFDDGLAVGQFVLGNNSVIGSVSEVSSRTARVKLITDGMSNMVVKVEGQKLVRLMQGVGNNRAKIGLVKAKINLGSKIFTEKKPGYLDSPMIIGSVTECVKDDDNPLLWNIMVSPACEIERLTDVAIMIMNPND